MTTTTTTMDDASSQVEGRKDVKKRRVERDNDDVNDDYYDVDEKNTFQLRLAPRTMAQGKDSDDDDDETTSRQGPGQVDV